MESASGRRLARTGRAGLGAAAERRYAASVRRTRFPVLAGLIGVLVIATGFAAAGATRQQFDYRFTGAVENGLRIPTHFARAGDGFYFSLYDAFSRGRPTERYSVCIGRSGKPPVQCWKRVARFGVDKLALGLALPRKVPYGQLTVRWSVGGQVVARWPLAYMRSD
jgi:hypothetical protein